MPLATKKVRGPPETPLAFWPAFSLARGPANGLHVLREAGRLGPINRERTDWTGMAFGTCLACLVAFQQFKLPPVLPVLLADYHWDRTLAGGLMAIYALAGLLLSIPLGNALQRRGIFGALPGRWSVVPV